MSKEKTFFWLSVSLQESIGRRETAKANDLIHARSLCSLETQRAQSKK